MDKKRYKRSRNTVAYSRVPTEVELPRYHLAVLGESFPQRQNYPQAVPRVSKGVKPPQQYSERLLREDPT